MNSTKAQQRMADNEAVFRQANERVQRGFEAIKKIAREDKQEYLSLDKDAPLQFFCECSDENCQERIALTPSQYDEIHKQRSHFVLIQGHQVDEIENVVDQHDAHFVVEKHVMPSLGVTQLKNTAVDNT